MMGDLLPPNVVFVERGTTVHVPIFFQNRPSNSAGLSKAEHVSLQQLDLAQEWPLGVGVRDTHVSTRAVFLGLVS